MRVIRDAVHGDMFFDPHEMAVIDTSTLQRLRGIKQLGTSNLVFPSAGHSRFEHSLGTCWLTRKMIDLLRGKGNEISEEDARTARLAALLHDITHVPFGHTFEDERRLFERHDRSRDRLNHFLHQPDLSRALRASGVANRVADVLGGDHSEPQYIQQLVKGTVCADLLDYLRRDAYFCGLALSYDDRLFQSFDIADGRLIYRLHRGGDFRRDAISELVHLLQMRYSLTERVYYHHAKIVAGAMISRALELLLDAGAIGMQQLFELRDDAFLLKLSEAAAASAGVADILSDLGSRTLFKRVYLLTLEGLGRPGLAEKDRDQLAADYHLNTAHRRKIEAEFAAQLGIPEAHIIIYCPSADMSLKEADVPVELREGDIRPLSTLGHPDVEALKQNHRGLWKFYVFLRRSHSPLYTSAAQLCERHFHHPNQLPSLHSGTLTFRR